MMTRIYRLIITMLLVTFFNMTIPGFAATPHHLKEVEADVTIKQLYQSLNHEANPTMQNRILQLSNAFMGKPYLLGALGEGIHSRFDQAPLYRTDAFDCETYVTTVLALALSDTPAIFQSCLRHIRYHQGKIAYIHRHHFTDLDWNRNNQQLGFLKDITKTIKDSHHNPVFKIAKAVINKPEWIRHLSKKAIRLYHPDTKKQQSRLKELHAKSILMAIKVATIPYLPLSALFNTKGQANAMLFSQIPNGAIIEIIRPDWNLKAAIGTNLNVSHLGFAIWKNKQLYFREASSLKGKIVDLSLIDYLHEALTSPTIKGINVQVVQPKTPRKTPCLVAVA